MASCGRLRWDRISPKRTAPPKPLFRPGAVAIVGASRDPAALGRRVLHGVVSSGFRGAVYPINPKVAELEGLRCYASVTDAPRGIDLAVICVPRPLVLMTIE